MPQYCTLFDRNYLSRGLALYRSLARHGGDFKLFTLCLDNPTREVLTALALPRVEIIAIESLEDSDHELRNSRTNRTTLEFYFACKPSLVRFVLNNFEAVPRITYLDSDLYFFSTPGPLERALAESDITLTPHRFPAGLKDRERYGLFNAGWISVRSSTEGRRFVEWWRQRCIEWSGLAVEEARFGDQKYLDYVPTLFRNVVSVLHPGMNAAPWNIEGLRFDVSENGVTIEGQPLILFHFHGMKRVLPRLYDSGLHWYGARLPTFLRKYIYRPYLEELADCQARLKTLPQTVRSHLGSPDASSVGRWTTRLKVVARILATRTALIGP